MTGSPHSHFRRAVEADTRGDLLETIRCLEEGLRCQPNHGYFWAWLGAKYNEREQFAAALDAFERAFALGIRDASLHFNRSISLEALGNTSAAEAEVCKAARLEEMSYQWVRVGVLRTALGKMDEAEAAFRHALTRDPEDAEAMYNLAVVIRRREPAEALRLLRSALSIDPEYADAHAELGFQLAAIGDDAAAELSILTAIRIDPTSAWPRIYLADILARTGRTNEAMESIIAACDLAPLMSTARWMRGSLLEAAGERWEALKHYQIAVEIAPRDGEAALRLGTCLRELGMHDQASIWLMRARQLGSGSD